MKKLKKRVISFSQILILVIIEQQRVITGLKTAQSFSSANDKAKPRVFLI
jgi:hypothetical protein